MEKLSFEVPSAISQKLIPYQDKLSELVMLGLQQFRIQDALMLYSRRLVSFGRAAELADLSEKEMIRQAYAAGLQPHWSEEMAKEELA